MSYFHFFKLILGNQLLSPNHNIIIVCNIRNSLFNLLSTPMIWKVFFVSRIITPDTKTYEQHLELTTLM